MENGGIQPVMNVGSGYNDGFGFGGSGLWLFAILALMWGGNGGFFGNNNLGFRPSTAEDVNNGFNFAELQQETRDILSTVNSTAAATTAAVNQAKYDNINVAKDIQNNLTAQLSEIKMTQANTLAHQNECCCSVLRAIDASNANTIAQVQKVLDTISANKIEALQSKVNALELAQAVSGVVRYPNSMAYNAGTSPFCNNGCGCGNI